MNNSNLEIWGNLTFTTKGYRKNFDLVVNDEHIITEYDGTISKLRIDEGKVPEIIGEYSFSIWNLKLGKILNVDLLRLLKRQEIELAYSELYSVINNNYVNLSSYRRIIVLHTVILKKEYRKKEICEELIETLYRDFYNSKTLMLTLVLPIQKNINNFNHYYNHKMISVKSYYDDNCINERANQYYSLSDLSKYTDNELNEYKLFNVAKKCGFKRIQDTYLFILTPQKILNRLKNKFKLIKSNENKIKNNPRRSIL